MNNYRKTVAWSEEDKAWIATAPDFPGLSAAGDTEPEALAELQEVITAAIEEYREAGWKLPVPQEEPAEFSGQLRLRLPKTLHALAARRAQQEGVSLNALLQSFVAQGLGLQNVAHEPGSAAREAVWQSLRTQIAELMDEVRLGQRFQAVVWAADPFCIPEPNPLQNYYVASEPDFHTLNVGRVTRFRELPKRNVQRIQQDTQVRTLPREALK